MYKIVPILHNIRSAHNVGSLLRTSDGLGLKEVWVSGYTPYPLLKDDARLPHVAKRATEKISKTSLGAENNIQVRHFESIESAIRKAKDHDFQILALEQAENSVPLPNFKLQSDSVLLLGNEVTGLGPKILKKTDVTLEIGMHGKKESFNVSVAAAIALYVLTTS